MASDQGKRENEARDDAERRQTRSSQKRPAATSSSAQRRRTNETRRPAGKSGGTSAQQGSARTAKSRANRPAAQAGARPAEARSASGGSKRRPAGAQRKAAAANRSADSARRSADAPRRGSDAARRSSDTARRRSADRKRIALPEGVQALVDKLPKLPDNLNVAAFGKLPMPIIAGACVAALALVLLVHHALRLNIQLNGEKATIWRGTSIERLLDKKLVEPKPGDLVAVDGSLLAEGEGEICTATIDGTPVTDLKTKIHRKADVQITDGDDITEKFTTEEETIPHGTVDASREFDSYWYASLHLLSDGEDGLLVSRTGKQSGITVTEVEKEAVDAGYCIYTAQPDEKVIALTFDDGPWPDTTDQILDILEENGAKATFFTIGDQIASYADSVRRAHKLGCQVCTHSWDHAAGSGDGVNLTLMTSQEQIDEVLKGYQAIADALGEEPAHIMRAPGGNFYGSIIDTLWPYVDVEVGWDVDTEDWRLPGADAIAERILSAKSGQVVLMHDGGGDRTQTVEALRIALPQLVSAGYKLVTIDELLAYGRPSSASSTSASGEAGVITIS